MTILTRVGSMCVACLHLRAVQDRLNLNAPFTLDEGFFFFFLPGHISILLYTWFERHDNVDPTSTLQLGKSHEESLTKMKPQVGKSGLWNFQSTCQYYNTRWRCYYDEQWKAKINKFACCASTTTIICNFTIMFAVLPSSTVRVFKMFFFYCSTLVVLQ